MSESIINIEAKLHQALFKRFKTNLSDLDMEFESADEELERVTSAWLSIEQGVLQEKSSEPWEICYLPFIKEIEAGEAVKKIQFDLVCRQYYIDYREEDLPIVYNGKYKIVIFQFSEDRAEHKPNLEGLLSLQALIVSDLLEIELSNLSLEVLWFSNNLHLESLLRNKTRTVLEDLADSYLSQSE